MKDNKSLSILWGMQEFLHLEYFKAILVIGIGALILLPVNIILKRRIKALQKKQQEGEKIPYLHFLMFFQRIAVPLAFLGLLASATKIVTFNEENKDIVTIAYSILMTFIIVHSLNKSIDLAFERYFEYDWANRNSKKNIKPLLSLVKFILWVIGIIFLLANLGLDVSTALAGLGVGGIAVAIAAQGILGDLFSYLVIFLDKPFELGDFIVFGDKSGVVESIGIKSIRIRVLSGEILIISNSDLTSSRVHNYKRMLRRRVLFTTRVVYETPAEKLEKIPSIIKDVITSTKTVEGVSFDRSHFNAFCACALMFEAVYYVPSNGYTFYMDTEQEIYYKLFRAFQEEEIEFAYPTQRIYTKDMASTSVTTQVVPSQSTL